VQDKVNTLVGFSNLIVDATNLVINIATPLLGAAACDVVSQVVTETAVGTPGLAQRLLASANALVNNAAASAPVDLMAAERAAVQGVDTSHTISLASSRVLKAAYNILASFATPANINALILDLSDNQPQFTLANLSSQYGVALNLPAQYALPFFVHIDVINITASNASTVSQAMLLRNPAFDLVAPQYTLNYTTDTRVQLDNLKLNLVLSVNVTDHVDPGWVSTATTPLQSTTTVNIVYSLSLTRLVVEFALLSVVDADALLPLTFGQLLGKTYGYTTPVGQSLAALMCLQPALVSGALSSLNISLADLSTPVFTMKPLDPGMVTLVNSATSALLGIFKGGVLTQLPAVTQFVLRPLINSVVSSLSSFACPAYVDAGAPVYADFVNSHILRVARFVVDNTIGGPVIAPANPVSINVLLHDALLYVFEVFDFPFIVLGVGQWLFLPDYRFIPAAHFAALTAPALSYIAITGAGVAGLDSVTSMQLLPSPSPTVMSVALGMGTAANPLAFALNQHYVAHYVPALYLPSVRPALIDEAVNLTLQVYGIAFAAQLDVKLDLNTLYSMPLSLLANPNCWRVPFPTINITASLVVAHAAVLISSVSSGNANFLQSAVALLKTESQTVLPAMINYVLSSVVSLVASFLNTDATAPVLTTVTCKDATSSLIATTLVRVVNKLAVSNFTQLVLGGTGPQPPAISPADADELPYVGTGATALQLSSSVLAQLPNKLAGLITNAQYIATVTALGNANKANGFLSQLFTTEPDGNVTFNLNFTSLSFLANGFELPYIAGAVFKLEELTVTRISAVDFSTIELINPLSKYVTRTHISMPGDVALALHVSVAFPQSLKGQLPASTLLTEHIYVNTTLTDLDFTLQLLTAFDTTVLSTLTLGQFIQFNADQSISFTPHVFACAFGLFFPAGLQIPELNLTVSRMGDFHFYTQDLDGVLISQGTQAFVQSFVQIVLDFYSGNLGDFTQGFVRTFLQDYIFIPATLHESPCPTVLVNNATANRYVVFDTNPLIASLHTLLTVTLPGADGSYALVNSLLSSLVDDFYLFSDPYGFTNVTAIYNGIELGTFTGYVRNINVVGLGTLRGLDLLDPVNGNTTNNSIALAGPTTLSFEVYYVVYELFPKPLSDHLAINLTLGNFTASTSIALEIDLVELVQIPASTLVNLNQIACAAQAVRSIGISSISIDPGAFTAQVRCVGVCQSPMLEEIANGGTWVSDDSGAANIRAAAKAFTAYLLSSDFLQRLQTFLVFSPATCAASLDLGPIVSFISPQTLPPTFNVAIVLALATAGVMAGLFVLTPFLWLRHQRLKAVLLREDLTDANQIPNATPVSVTAFMTKAERSSLSIGRHPIVPWYVKVGVPLVCVCNEIMVVLSYFFVGLFDVQAFVQFAGTQSNGVTIIHWTVAETVNDMWNGGAYIIALLLALAAVVYPGIKNLLVLLVFYAPTTFLSHWTRSRVVLGMDYAGKIRFFDIFIIILVLAAIDFHIDVADSIPAQILRLALPSDALVLDVTTTPRPGVAMLTFVAVLSLLTTHVVSFYADKIEYSDNRLFHQIDNKQDKFLTPLANIKEVSAYRRRQCAR